MSQPALEGQGVEFEKRIKKPSIKEILKAIKEQEKNEHVKKELQKPE